MIMRRMRDFPCQGPQPVLQPRGLGAPAQQIRISVYTLPCGYTKHTQDMFPEARMDPVAPLPAVLLPGMGPAALTPLHPSTCPYLRAGK